MSHYHHGITILAKHFFIPNELWDMIDLEVKKSFKKRVKALDRLYFLAPFITSLKNSQKTFRRHISPGGISDTFTAKCVRDAIKKYVPPVVDILNGVKSPNGWLASNQWRRLLVREGREYILRLIMENRVDFLRSYDLRKYITIDPH